MLHYFQTIYANYFRIGCGKQFYIINRSGIHMSFVCTSNMNSLVYNEKPWVNRFRITSSFCPNFPHSFLDNESYATKKNWFCAINNRTRSVVLIKRKFLRRRFYYYTNCQSTFNPTVLSSYLLMCGDIHPNPGPTATSTNVNSNYSNNRGTSGRKPEDKHSNLFCMYMNARSLKKNIHTQGNVYVSNLMKFQEMVYSESVDLMFVSETWLNSSISNKEVLPYGYDVFRTDRALGRSGGGVLLAIKHGIFINCTQVTSIATINMEAVAVQCTLTDHTKWLFVCCYRPPNSKDLADIRSFADNIFPSFEKIIIVGDFNLPNISWTNSSYISVGTLGQEFCDTLDDYFMSQLCLLPTRESNILDLLITNQPEQVSFMGVCDPSELGMSSDHKLIRFKYSMRSTTFTPNKRLVYDYRRTDFDKLRQRLTDMDICSLITSNGHSQILMMIGQLGRVLL